MKRYTLLLSFCVLSILVPSHGLADNPSTGKFKATMGGKKDDLNVTCDVFRKDRVMFRSDDSGYGEAIDTNGDDIVITGSPGSGKRLTLALEINDKGQSYVVNSAIKGQKLDLKMSGNTLTENEKILSRTFPQPIIVFTLTCEQIIYRRSAVKIDRFRQNIS